jgi:hypothetical protein
MQAESAAEWHFRAHTSSINRTGQLSFHDRGSSRAYIGAHGKSEKTHPANIVRRLTIEYTAQLPTSRRNDELNISGPVGCETASRQAMGNTTPAQTGNPGTGHTPEHPSGCPAVIRTPALRVS